MLKETLKEYYLQINIVLKKAKRGVIYHSRLDTNGSIDKIDVLIYSIASEIPVVLMIVK